ncbi:MAG: hypothetical protein HS132_02725 [Planctomycetia bacterium]|nr:hypothetical protein [Planctomycetia bacterium]
MLKEKRQIANYNSFCGPVAGVIDHRSGTMRGYPNLHQFKELLDDMGDIRKGRISCRL